MDPWLRVIGLSVHVAGWVQRHAGQAPSLPLGYTPGRLLLYVVFQIYTVFIKSFIVVNVSVFILQSIYLCIFLCRFITLSIFCLSVYLSMRAGWSFSLLVYPCSPFNLSVDLFCVPFFSFSQAHSKDC